MRPVAFMSANFVARESGFAIADWGEGDRATNAAYRPLATFRERFGALLTEVRELGFLALDLWGGHLNAEWATDEHVRIACDELARAELDVTAYQVWVGGEHLERACEIAAMLGAPVLTGVVPLDDERLAGLLAAHGLTFGLENHPERSAQEMLDKIGPYEACVDTGWFATHGYDPVLAVEQLGHRVVHVHLKDVVHEGLPHETCRFGEGIVDIEGCVGALRRIGYEGALTIEHEPYDRDPSIELAAMRRQLEEWLR